MYEEKLKILAPITTEQDLYFLNRGSHKSEDGQVTIHTVIT